MKNGANIENILPLLNNANAQLEITINITNHDRDDEPVESRDNSLPPDTDGEDYIPEGNDKTCKHLLSHPTITTDNTLPEHNLSAAETMLLLNIHDNKFVSDKVG